MGTLIVGGVLFIIVGFVITTMVRDKRKGKSLQCGCDCSKCSGHCSQYK